MVVSKSNAESIADKVLKPKYDEIDALKKALSEKVTKYVKSLIPDQVKKVPPKFNGFLNRENGIYLYGNGFQGEYYSLTESTPVEDNRHTPDEKSGNDIKNIHRLIDKKKDEYWKLRKDIVTAIVQLRTYKRVQEQFPEAAAFLSPPATNMALSVNLSDIKKRINEK